MTLIKPPCVDTTILEIPFRSKVLSIGRTIFEPAKAIAGRNARSVNVERINLLFFIGITRLCSVIHEIRDASCRKMRKEKIAHEGHEESVGASLAATAEVFKKTLRLRIALSGDVQR